MVDTEYITKSAGLEKYGWPGPDVITDGGSLEFDDDNPRAYMGIEPSGKPHLGHALQIERLNRVEEAGFDTYILIADLHAFKNGKPEGVDGYDERKAKIDQLSEEVRESLEPLCNSGIEFIRGSEFQRNDGYNRTLEELKIDIPNDRAKAAVGEVAGDDEVSVAQVEYPIMQVADMYYFGEEGNPVDLAVGGTDQRKIHALARDYSPESYDKVDSIHYPLIGEHLASRKMSKENDPIFVEDPKDVVNQKIHSMDLFNDIDEISDEFDLSDWNPKQEETKVEEAIIMSSVPLQLAAELVFARGDSLQVDRPDKYGGDVTYNDPERLLEDTAKKNLHPKDIKNNIAPVVNDILNP